MSKQIYIDSNGNEIQVSGTVNSADMMPMSANDSTKVSEAIGDLSQLTTSVTSSLVGAINEIASYTPVYNNTASGAIATFDTSLALPLQDCTIAINAVQESGTPTPSSPKAITGFTGANITRCGKNRLNVADKTTTYSSYIIDNEYVPMVAGYYSLSFEFSGTSNSSSLRIDDENGTAVFTTAKTITSGHNEYLLNLPSKGTFVKLFSNAVGTYSNFQIEQGNQFTNFEAYNGNNYTFDFGQTIYGGLLDVTSGKLTVTHARVDLGSLTQWNKNTSFTNTLFVANITGKKTNNSNCLCTNYTNGGIATGETFLNNMQNNSFASDTSNGIYIRDDSKVSLSGDDFKTAMSGVYLVYELATPQTYQLTPTQISAIVGTNNIFTDTNGDTSVVYACSLKDYIGGQ